MHDFISLINIHYGNIDLRPFDCSYGIAFYIHNYPIRWYAILSVSGYLLAIISYLLILKFKYKVNPELGFYFIFLAMPMILFGARFWSCLMGNSRWDHFFDFWDGGMAVQGGVVFGAITGIIYFNLVANYSKLALKKVVVGNRTYIKKTSVWIYADAIIPTIMLGQAIGRWGNYFNGGLFGQEVTNPNDLAWLHNLMPDVYNHMIAWQTNESTGMYAGHLYEPLFLYSSFFLIISFIGIQIFGVFRFAKLGSLTALYFIIYGIIRFVLESQRNIAFHYVGTYILNGILMVLGVLLLIYIYVGQTKFRTKMFWGSIYQNWFAPKLIIRTNLDNVVKLPNHQRRFIWIQRSEEQQRYFYRY